MRNHIPKSVVALAIIAGFDVGAVVSAEAAPAGETFRLYHGITLYVDNSEGKPFDVDLDLRDINVYANGPREVLLKVYDPDGQAVVREIIPDDGVVSESYLPAIGGWDHELDYYALCRSRGTMPMIRWSSWSDPARLATLAKRTFTHKIEGGKQGIYRMVLVGERDHYATIKIDPDLKYAVCGHHTFLHGQGSQWKKSFIYVPRGTVGLHLAFAEPDAPHARNFTLTAPDGSKLFDGMATGSFAEQVVTFEKPGQYDDQVLTLDVSDGPNDYLVKVTLQRADKDYTGMGSEALLARDEATARAFKGGAIYEGDEVFWHPFQVRLHKWLSTNKLDEALQTELNELARLMRFIGPGDGRGSKTWNNWGYAFGYYGCKIWRPGWLLLQRDDVPDELKQIIREGFLVGGDRLSFAIGIERVNGNAFTQIPVALWYCHQATGDPLQKQRFETYFERWRTGGWGDGCGISKSGDSQEHFAHDANYGWYILENWAGGIWVPDGILADTNDPRFKEVFDRVHNLYSYISCPDAPANPWSSRTHPGVHKRWQTGSDGKWKGEPGPDFTVSVNDGNEWFAARRKNYYLLTFHGQLAPAWLTNTFYGQIGFGGGVICQLTVPGRGTVLASTLKESYGKGMDLSNWRNFHIHSVVGQMWDGQTLVTGVSEHADARLEQKTVTSSGEVRDRPIRTTRKYTYEDDGIACEVQLAPTGYQRLLKLWSGDRQLAHVKEAYEMIPFLPAEVTIEGTSGDPAGKLTAEPADASAIVIDRGGYGVRVVLEKPHKVSLGAGNTVLIELAAPAEQATPADQIALRYRLVPFNKAP